MAPIITPWFMLCLLMACFHLFTCDGVTTEHICSNEIFQPDCGPNRTIGIQSAYWGRMENKCTVYLPWDRDCKIDKKQILSNFCDGKQHCHVPIKGSNFNQDDCTYDEYLEVKYLCITATEDFSLTTAQSTVTNRNGLSLSPMPSYNQTSRPSQPRQSTNNNLSTTAYTPSTITLLFTDIENRSSAHIVHSSALEKHYEGIYIGVGIGFIVLASICLFTCVMWRSRLRRRFGVGNVSSLHPDGQESSDLRTIGSRPGDDKYDYACFSPREMNRAGDVQEVVFHSNGVYLTVTPEPVVANGSCAVPENKESENKMYDYADAMTKRMELRSSGATSQYDLSNMYSKPTKVKPRTIDKDQIENAFEQSRDDEQTNISGSYRKSWQSEPTSEHYVGVSDESIDCIARLSGIDRNPLTSTNECDGMNKSPYLTENNKSDGNSHNGDLGFNPVGAYSQQGCLQHRTGSTAHCPQAIFENKPDLYSREADDQRHTTTCFDGDDEINDLYGNMPSNERPIAPQGSSHEEAAWTQPTQMARYTLTENELYS